MTKPTQALVLDFDGLIADTETRWPAGEPGSIAIYAPALGVKGKNAASAASAASADGEAGQARSGPPVIRSDDVSRAGHIHSCQP